MEDWETQNAFTPLLFDTVQWHQDTWRSGGGSTSEAAAREVSHAWVRVAEICRCLESRRADVRRDAAGPSANAGVGVSRRDS